ncbi:hydroxysqualene dehydroxylase HpnE [Uliginosibacterium sediminicola]|uniref:Hydroxysqualene dehydroxylase HpnE n=2 Tax=Uliginosibacterium sediminicola TaxID=2024550 RepID=A0ABU9Z0Z7_9RHOO
MNMARVAVIGGGYAGLSAAVELARAGVPVTVFEASRTLGGRARVVEKDGRRIDNGQHILIGAYTETLRMLRQLRVPTRNLLSMPFNLHVVGRLSLRAGNWPAPLHLATALLGAKELSWADRLSALRLMRYIKRIKYTLNTDHSVSQLLSDSGQTDAMRELMWEPLCIAALNTPPHEASAQVFINVLRDALTGSASASEMLIPRVDLSELLPVPAAQFLALNGGVVNIATPIKGIEQDGEEFRLIGNPFEGERFSQVIVAVAPYHVSDLLAPLPDLALLRSQIDAMTHQPITTIYLQYAETVSLPEPMMAFADSSIQWLFDRGQLGADKGLIAAVISARGEHSNLSREELALRAHEAVERIVPRLAAPQWSTVITEKRATFACGPAVWRPIATTPLKNLLLAGDYLQSRYPATIEAAVRSGLIAARQVLRMTRQSD